MFYRSFERGEGQTSNVYSRSESLRLSEEAYKIIAAHRTRTDAHLAADGILSPRQLLDRRSYEVSVELEDSLDVLVYHRGSDSPQVGPGCVVCGEVVYAKARCKNCYQNARRAGESWCRLKECLEPVSIKSRGLCNKHYLRLRKWGFYERCLRDGCESEVYSKDFCLKHYTEAWRRSQKIKK